jgi:hypothetical protein
LQKARIQTKDGKEYDILFQTTSQLRMTIKMMGLKEEDIVSLKIL